MSSKTSQEKTSLPFIVHLITTGFYSGYAPVASGTCGSFVGLLFFYIPRFNNPFILLPVIVAVFFLGVWFSGMVAEEAHDTDPSMVVIDEIVGMWISLAFLPLTVFTLSASFILFRVFDVFKPSPARELERVHGGWGIMLDDVAAGIYANIVLQVIVYFFKI